MCVQLEKTYSDQFLQRCCSDGMREIPMPYSCRRRALYITENWSCVIAFLQCCSKYRGEELGIITPPEPTTPEPTTPEPTTPVPTITILLSPRGGYERTLQLERFSFRRPTGQARMGYLLSFSR